MQAIDRVLKRLDQESQRVALVCCLLVDQFKASRAPADLQEAQDFIRLGLGHARALIRDQRARRPLRSRHFSARARRRPDLGPLLHEHIARLQNLERLLERRRRILRASADALAWIALSDTPSAIPRLFRAQTHDIPDERGLIGHVAIQHAAHQSGRFLVLENDLTRCLGLGDLTVLSLEKPGLPPISVEVKTKAPSIAEGAEMDVQLALVELDHPAALSVLEDFGSLLGTGEGSVERPAVADTKQLSEFFEQSASVIRAHGSQAAKLGLVSGNWEAVHRVLRRAIPGKPVLDIAERGVWVGAIAQVGDGSRFEEDMHTLAGLVRRLVPKEEDQVISFAHTVQLEEHDEVGALGLPVAVWRLPPLIRAKILNTDLVLVSFVDLKSLSERLQERGIALEMTDTEWTVRLDNEAFHMAGPAVGRARLDIAFGGLNLDSFADRIEDLLVAQPSETA